jgi:alpha-tubulin suppressor-like RCC1 family protein
MPRFFAGAVLLTALAAAACDQPVQIRPPQPDRIELSRDSIRATYEARTHQVEATVRDGRGNAMPDAPVAWVSSDTAVASVAQDGLVTVLAPGTAHIIARSAEATATIPLTAIRNTAYGVPGEVAGDQVWSSVEASQVSCGRSPGGSILCWGGNVDGRLGRGSGPASATPAPVEGGLAFVQVSSGSGHSCGLTPDGTAYCWGSNHLGQLGDGSLEPRYAPTRVVGDTRFVELSAGYGHTCGLDAAGAAYCWGSSEDGQLGPVPAGEWCQYAATPFYCRKEPQRLETDLAFASLHAGGTHTCALTLGGEAYCWGSGALGYSARPETCQYAPKSGPGWQRSSECSRTPLPVAGGRNYTALAAGVQHMCGLTAGGEAYCWGTGTHGRLGDGTETEALLPVRVQSTGAFRQISAGWRHTCAVDTADQVHCWGRNAVGAVGNLAVYDARFPVPVGDIGPTQSVSAGLEHSCSVGNDGRARCWGLHDERLGRTP